MTAGRWLLFDVGCIECGADSWVLGVYPTREAAEAAAEAAAPGGSPERGWSYFSGEEHHVRVFELPAVSE